jgi:hypothetical protein
MERVGSGVAVGDGRCVTLKVGVSNTSMYVGEGIGDNFVVFSVLIEQLAVSRIHIR